MQLVKGKLENEISRIQKLTQEINDPSDLFKLKFIAYRFRLELSKYENMKNGAYALWCLDSMSYFMYIFRSSMDMLDEGDEYRAVTTTEIWQHDKPIGGDFGNVPTEYRKSFLEANHEAMGRKVNIERYFLVDSKSVWVKGSQENMNAIDVVERHLKFLGESARRVNIHFCPIEDFNNETTKDIAYAIIKNASCNSYMYLLSKKDKNGKLSLIHI